MSDAGKTETAQERLAREAGMKVHGVKKLEHWEMKDVEEITAFGAKGRLKQMGLKKLKKVDDISQPMEKLVKDEKRAMAKDKKDLLKNAAKEMRAEQKQMRIEERKQRQIDKNSVRAEKLRKKGVDVPKLSLAKQAEYIENLTGRLITVDGLTETQLEKIKKSFHFFDKNDDGFIAVSEMERVMLALGENPTKAEIEVLVDEVDIDGNGQIDFNEFAAMMARRFFEEEEEIRDAFRVLDRNEDGFITADELKYLMTNLGEKLTDAEVAEMLRDADKDGDGKINYEEFVSMMFSE